jgi:hypothetical protein
MKKSTKNKIAAAIAAIVALLAVLQQVLEAVPTSAEPSPAAVVAPAADAGVQ